MNSFDRRLIEKFFNNSCTPAEAKEVLEWFKTQQGELYLKERMHGDFFKTMDESKLSYQPSVPSEKMFSSISKGMKKERGVAIRPDHWNLIFRAAAAILVIATASIFNYWIYEGYGNEEIDTPQIYTTDLQHKKITLEDGTRIRLNEQSEIIISHDFSNDFREIELSGEAFFEVAHDPDRPFIIHANQTKIQVLGTSFNVKSRLLEENVQVAVREGSVSFGTNQKEGTGSSVILKGGQFGFMDLQNSMITVEEYAVDNYMSWISGRLLFDDHSLEQVCNQLARLHSLKCQFEEDSLKDIRLTADFPNDSIDRTLSVLALSTDLSYAKENDVVLWFHQ